MSEKKEILERVLLLMKYDNRITLSENQNIIIEQDMGMWGVTTKGDNYLEKFKPKLIKIKNFLGGELDVPDTTKTFKFEYKFKPSNLYPIDGTDNISGDTADFVYVKNLKSANPYFAKYFSDTSSDNKKFYYPSKNALTSYFGDSVYEFDIPKGTLIPFDREVKENEDDWFSDRQQGVEPTDKTYTFRPVKKIEKNDIKLALTPRANSMHGWKYLPGYYTRDKLPNKLVSYVPEIWIQYKSGLKLWWDEYGTYVEIAGSLILTVISGGIAAGLFAFLEISSISVTTLTWVIDTVLNGAFNLGIAAMHFDAHDNTQGFVSTFFAFLPVLHRFSSAIKATMAAKSITNELVVSASKEILEKLPKTSLKDKTLWKSFYKSLSPETRKVMKWSLSIPENEITPAAKKALKWANQRLIQQQTKGVLKFTGYVLKRGFTGLLKFMAQGAVDIKIMHSVESAVERVIGRKLNPKENVSILSVISNNALDNQVSFEQAANEYIQQVESGEKKPEEIAKDMKLDVDDKKIAQFAAEQEKIKTKYKIEDDEL